MAIEGVDRIAATAPEAASDWKTSLRVRGVGAYAATDNAKPKSRYAERFMLSVGFVVPFLTSTIGSG